MTTKKMKTMRKRMTKLQTELQEREQAVEDKRLKDIANYGVPLGNQQLVKKVLVTQRKIEELTERMTKEKENAEGRWELPAYDRKILNAIRNNKSGHNTSSENAWRTDNRHSGSVASRRAARKLHRNVSE